MLEIKVNIRNKFGKNANRRFRASKNIPAVIYGKSFTNLNILIKESLLVNKISQIKNSKILIIIKKNKQEIKVKIQNIQFHPYKNKLLHIDLLQI